MNGPRISFCRSSAAFTRSINPWQFFFHPFLWIFPSFCLLLPIRQWANVTHAFISHGFSFWTFLPPDQPTATAFLCMRTTNLRLSDPFSFFRFPIKATCGGSVSSACYAISTGIMYLLRFTRITSFPSTTRLQYIPFGYQLPTILPFGKTPPIRDHGIYVLWHSVGCTLLAHFFFFQARSQILASVRSRVPSGASLPIRVFVAVEV